MSKIRVEVPVGGSSGLYANIGVFRGKLEHEIELAFPGRHPHHRVSNSPRSKWYQPKLFKILKDLLEDNGRWHTGKWFTQLQTRKAKKRRTPSLV